MGEEFQMAKYTIGVDFGTLSARALVAEVGTGRELADATMNYPHGVMDEYLPTGERLKPDWALQHPQDYLDCLNYVIPEAMKQAGVSPEDVIGVGIDFTACTVVAVDAAGTPLCLKEEYAHNPHAYIKLWKHHAAQDEANRLNRIAEERGEEFLARYGGKISSEWMVPKIWQMLNEDPALYDAVDRFMEAGDWVVMQLTGVEARNACMAGYKAMWSKAQGYPSRDFFRALDPRLENLVEDKLSTHIYPIGAKAGEITPAGREDHGPSAGYRRGGGQRGRPCVPARHRFHRGRPHADDYGHLYLRHHRLRRGVHRARHVRRGGRWRGSGAVGLRGRPELRGRPLRLVCGPLRARGVLLRRPGKRARTCTCISRKRRKS